MNFRKKGEIGENIAAEYIKSLGSSIIERNYYSPFGEIDIIALNNRTIIFIEVKLRHFMTKGSPRDAVDYRKKRRMKHSAEHFIMTHPKYKTFNVRFDFIGIDASNEDNIDHISNIITESEF